MKVRGTVLLKETGRPEIVYGRKSDEFLLEHSVSITEAELLLGATLDRNVRVNKAVCDGLLIRNCNRFYVEVDNETMTLKQLRAKWLRYGKPDGFILVICHSMDRLRLLMRSAEHVKSFALFTRFRWLTSPSVSEPWIDWTCKRMRI